MNLAWRFQRQAASRSKTGSCMAVKRQDCQRGPAVAVARQVIVQVALQVDVQVFVQVACRWFRRWFRREAAASPLNSSHGRIMQLRPLWQGHLASNESRCLALAKPTLAVMTKCILATSQRYQRLRRPGHITGSVGSAVQQQSQL